MHDIVALEEMGIPGVFVATTAFAHAAAAQSNALHAAAAVVLVPHPIQNRTDSELHKLADAVIDDLVAALCSPTA